MAANFQGQSQWFQENKELQRHWFFFFFQLRKCVCSFCLWQYASNVLGWSLLIQRLPNFGMHTFLSPYIYFFFLFLCSSLTLNSTLINHIHKINLSLVCLVPQGVGKRHSLLNGISFMPGPDYKELDVHLRRMESGFGFRILGGDEPGQPVSWSLFLHFGLYCICMAEMKYHSVWYEKESRLGLT